MANDKLTRADIGEAYDYLSKNNIPFDKNGTAQSLWSKAQDNGMNSLTLHEMKQQKKNKTINTFIAIGLIIIAILHFIIYQT
ncbi:MAG: hypothetical protein ACPGXZ_00860 [Saprospiraceae bacterium]